LAGIIIVYYKVVFKNRMIGALRNGAISGLGSSSSTSESGYRWENNLIGVETTGVPPEQKRLRKGAVVYQQPRRHNEMSPVAGKNRENLYG